MLPPVLALVLVTRFWAQYGYFLLSVSAVSRFVPV